LPRALVAYLAHPVGIHWARSWDALPAYDDPVNFRQALDGAVWNELALTRDQRHAIKAGSTDGMAPIRQADEAQ